MTGWREGVLGILGLMWLLAPLFYFGYLIALPIRRRSRLKLTPLAYARRSTSFHAWWGVALSAPGMTVAVLGGPGSAYIWFGAPIALATLASWVIALHAKAGWRLPPVLRWVPLIVMLVGLQSFSAVSVWLNLDAGTETSDVGTVNSYPEALSNFVANWVMFTNFGLGFVAWLTVTMCFALSVRALDQLEPPTPSFQRYPMRGIRPNWQMPARI